LFTQLDRASSFFFASKVVPHKLTICDRQVFETVLHLAAMQAAQNHLYSRGKKIINIISKYKLIVLLYQRIGKMA